MLQTQRIIFDPQWKSHIIFDVAFLWELIIRR